MGLLCKLGLHNWEGCKCKNCGQLRNEGHSWGRFRCETCGTSKNEYVTIPSTDPIQAALLEHKYLAENPCSCGGTWRMLTHTSPIPSGTSEMLCKCSGCEAEQLFVFRLRRA